MVTLVSVCRGVCQVLSWYFASFEWVEMSWSQFGSVCFRARYPGATLLKSALRYAASLWEVNRGTPNSPYRSGLIETSLLYAFLSRSECLITHVSRHLSQRNKVDLNIGHNFFIKHISYVLVVNRFEQ